jgi:hypothetical protein
VKRPGFYSALVSGGPRQADEAVWNLRGIAVVTHDCFPYEVGGPWSRIDAPLHAVLSGLCHA